MTLLRRPTDRETRAIVLTSPAADACLLSLYIEAAVVACSRASVTSPGDCEVLKACVRFAEQAVIVGRNRVRGPQFGNAQVVGPAQTRNRLVVVLAGDLGRGQGGERLGLAGSTGSFMAFTNRQLLSCQCLALIEVTIGHQHRRERTVGDNCAGVLGAVQIDLQLKRLSRRRRGFGLVTHKHRN